MKRRIKVAPSVIAADQARLGEEVQRIEQAGADLLHIDVMDGHFVPNITIGPDVVRALDKVTDLPLEAHLMISNPQRFIQPFSQAGADYITIHIETCKKNASKLISQIKGLGKKAGISLNPDTPLAEIEDCLDVVDLVLIMSVEAGFGGQVFNPVALDRLRQVRDMVVPEVLLEVDGGVNEDTIADCAEAGAHLFVVGSALFAKQDYGRYMQELVQLASVTS